MTRRTLALVVLAGLGPSWVWAARLGRQVVPTFEAVVLEVDAGRGDYSGRVEITLQVSEPTDHFSLHARDMTLTEVALRSAQGPIEVRHEVVDDQVLVRAGAPLAPGEFRLTIAFEAPFNTRAVALYRMEENGLAYAFTQFEAADARGAFPCFDEPAFKIPWQLTVTVPAAHIAVSNTPVESQTRSAGSTTCVFQKTRPMPSYLLALATGPLDTVDMPGLGVPGRVVTTRGNAALTSIAIQQTPPLLRALEEYFGQPYPYEKLDFIAIPEYWAGAMEHPGAVTYAAGLLLLDPETAALSQKQRLAKVIAHELAHMWFGNLVTMEWWDDLWLNESFADWMGDKIAHQVFPGLRVDLQSLAGVQEVMTRDSLAATAPVRRPVESTDTLMQDVGLQYDKGKAILGMLEAWIGEDRFRSGVLAYLDRHAWGNAVASDLWRALDAASDGAVGSALATFVDLPGVPLVDVLPLEDGRVRLAQRRFSNAGVVLEPHLWKIPVGLRYEVAGQAATRVVLLDRAETVVTLTGTPTWVFPNAGARGYYRWRVPDSMLARLTSDAQRLSDAERMELVSNLPALLRSGSLTGGRLLAALNGLADDPEPMVVASVLDQLDGLQSAFVSADLEDEFAAYVRRALRPALIRAGMLPREGESETISLVRPRLLLWLGDAGRDPEVLRFAEEQARAYLEDPGSVPPSLASACLALAVMDDGPEQFDVVRQRFEQAAAPTERNRYLQSIGYFRDPHLVGRALDYAFTGPLRPNELFTIPRGVGATEAGRDRAYRWMEGNYPKLAARLPPEFMGFMPYFASGCSAERLASARAFFAEPAHQAKGTERLLGRVAAEVEECLALRAREGEDVRRFLESQAAR
jgi:cytosol alanyl aminopeptidase